MSEQASAPAAAAPISVRDAAAIIAAPPPEEKRKEQTPEAAAPEPADAPRQESAEEADAAPAEEQPSGETEGSDDPELQAPPIDPPKSWTKEDKAAFALLPREAQERLVALDRTREVELRRGQNEAAERSRAAEAQARAAEQERAQYAQALPLLLTQLNADYTREFGNPSWDEIQSWSQNEPDKYLRWDAAYKRAQGVAGELARQQAWQAAQADQQRKAYVAEQGRLLAEKAPEFADPKKVAEMRGEVLSYMESIGWTRPELEAHAMQFQPLSIHDHRLQLIIRDAMSARAAQAALKQTAPRPNVPPVQKPGPASSKGEVRQTRLKELDSTLKKTGSLRDAAKLIGALS